MGSFYRSILAGIACTALLAISTPAMAQRRGQASSTLGLIQKDPYRSALRLTDEQQEKLKEVNSKAAPDFKAYLAEMRELEGEARDAKRKQFAVDTATLRDEAGVKALAVLTDAQRSQFAGLLIENMGSAALRQPSMRDSLKVTDDQNKKIEAALAERSKAIREQGIRATSEERDKLKAAEDAKVVALLTADQRKSWAAFASAGSANNAPATRVAGGGPQRGRGSCVGSC